jgi:excisionase family DNA binding protein
MEVITFDQLPAAVNQLFIKLDAIEKLLNTAKEPQLDPEKWFNLQEVCDYLPDRPAKATVYGWVHSGLIPNHKSGKKLRFLKSDIDSWMRSGRRKTNLEMAADASQYLTKKRGQRNGN